VPELSEEQWKSIDPHLLSGHKIQAIKVYREITGVGLAEAKDAVEQRHRQLEPESVHATGKAKGCVTILCVAAGLSLSAAWAWVRMTGSTH
jgi:hypothetical protein